MDFKKFSKKTIGRINIELEQLLKEWRNEAGNTTMKLLPLIDKFIEGCRGGKRIRGVLVVLGYELARGKGKGERGKLNSNEIFKIAASFEIFHTAILAHDDVIDQSPKRRGQPSLYVALGESHNGVSQAICLGDAGFFLALKIISEINFPEKAKIAALRWFSKIMLDTAMGEMLDVEKGDLLTIMKLKTAKYTVSGPLILGAILAGADQKLLNKLDQFGENLGIAFQIQDDILGIFGSEKIMGKSAASDIEEGKNTLLYNDALRKVNPLQRQSLSKFYGKGSMGDQGLQEVKRIFKETGALDQAKNEVEKYKNRAMKILPGITKDQKMSKLLEQMAEYLVERNK